MPLPDCNPPLCADDVADAKAKIRALILARRAAIPEQERLAAARALVDVLGNARFRAILPPQGAGIAGYMPIRGEIDPRPLMAAIAAEGYVLALPRMQGETLDFAAFTEEEALVAGRFGTREPAPDAAIIAPALILTPLVAFDEGNRRLGYGKGFYDRAFAAAPDARRVGLAFALQRVERVPHALHDASLDAVFTEIG